jgi:TolB-like protein
MVWSVRVLGGGVRLDEVRLGSRTLQPGRQLLANGRREPIGKRALDVLSVLAEARGEIVTKDELLDAVWPGVTVEENALQVHIVALRKALGPEAERLRTIRGVGYVLQSDGGADPPLADRPECIPAAETAPSGPSIVVLPFDNMSADPEQEYFADGMTEDIITDLSKVSALRVIARNSAFAFKGTHVDTAEVARRLNVTHVVVGSVRRSDRRLRVSAQLIDGQTNDHLWAERFDRDLADIFDVQDELTASIVNALKVKLLPSERKGIEARSTHNAEAYDLYIRARALRATMQIDNIERSLDLYRQALALDPNFAIAWAGLASALIALLSLVPGFLDPRDEIDAALARARELAPNLPEVTASRTARCMLGRDWSGLDECIATFARGHDANWSIHSHALLALGRAEEACEQQFRVWRSDPLSPGATWGLQFHLDCAGRLDAAEAEYENSKDLSGMRDALEWEATTRVMALGDHDRVREQLAWFINHRERLLIERQLSEVIESPDAALALLRSAFADPAYQYALRLDGIAHWAAYFGDQDFALTVIRHACLVLPGGPVLGIWHPNFANVRKLPGFKSVLQDLGLVDHWRKTGNWGEFVQPVGETDFEIVV